MERRLNIMKKYGEPIVDLLTVEEEDILTSSPIGFDIFNDLEDIL